MSVFCALQGEASMDEVELSVLFSARLMLLALGGDSGGRPSRFLSRLAWSQVSEFESVLRGVTGVGGLR